MITVDLKRIKWSFNKDTNSILISEKDVKFATEYTVISSKTGDSRVFKFSHSTGPEFNPNTRWIYEDGTGIKLEVCNDAKMVMVAAANYLKGKLRNS